MLFGPVDYLAFNLDDLRTLSCLMNCGVIKIKINDPLWIPWPPRFACRWQRSQLVKQLAQNRAVMGQFIRDKQGLALTTVGQILQHLLSIAKFAPANPERYQ